MRIITVSRWIVIGHGFPEEIENEIHNQNQQIKQEAKKLGIENTVSEEEWYNGCTSEYCIYADEKVLENIKPIYYDEGEGEVEQDL